MSFMRSGWILIDENGECSTKKKLRLPQMLVEDQVKERMMKTNAEILQEMNTAMNTDANKWLANFSQDDDFFYFYADAEKIRIDDTPENMKRWVAICPVALRTDILRFCVDEKNRFEFSRYIFVGPPVSINYNFLESITAAEERAAIILDIEKIEKAN
jgi:chemotaxis signal transduction protein